MKCAPILSRSPGAGFMYFRPKTSSDRAYLQIVERRREGASVRQQVIATLGRVEDLRDSGRLERLLRSGARFAAKVAHHRRRSREFGATHRAGSGVRTFVGRDGLPGEVIEVLAGARRHDFALERAVFLTVLHRLFSGGSDRAADRWRVGYRIDGVERLDLHHLYRAMAWLGEELAESQQDGATPFAPRCLKDVVEEELFARRRDLFSTLDLDTTSPRIKSRIKSGGRAARRRDGAAFPKIIGPISIRCPWRFCSMATTGRFARRCGRATPPIPAA
jgi:hypothetical protein